jgi:hypothetical protein
MSNLLLRKICKRKIAGGDKKKINLLASSLGFEGDAPGVFLKNLSTYKEDSLELFTGALDEIFQYLSPGSAALRAAPPAEPIVAEDAYLQKPAKKKNKKKKKGKRKNKGAASSSTSSADVPASEEESEGEDEGEEEKEGAQAGLTERPVVQPDAGGAAAASVEYLGTQLGEMGLPTGRPRVPPAHGEAIPETPVKSTKKPPLPQEERAKPAPQEVQLSSKKEGMLEDTFAAIWRTDPRIDAKGFVTFWESFGFVNTQRAALGNGFFVLQHPQGYKVKTSHAPHNKDEKVFNMALSFAKYLLEAAGITGIRDAAWQAKLKLFLDKPCKGMGR